MGKEGLLLIPRCIDARFVFLFPLMGFVLRFCSAFLLVFDLACIWLKPSQAANLGQQAPVVAQATGRVVRADPGGRILQGRPVGMPPRAWYLVMTFGLACMGSLENLKGPDLNF